MCVTRTRAGSLPLLQKSLPCVTPRELLRTPGVPGVAGQPSLTLPGAPAALLTEIFSVV